MIRGIYGAAMGMDVASQSQDITSQNLAHLTVPGYRARGGVFESFDGMVMAASNRSASGVTTPRDYIDFRPGALQPTGRKLDAALDGDSFFVLNGPDGPLYTR